MYSFYTVFGIKLDYIELVNSFQWIVWHFLSAVFPCHRQPLEHPPVAAPLGSASTTPSNNKIILYYIMLYLMVALNMLRTYKGKQIQFVTANQMPQTDKITEIAP